MTFPVSNSMKRTHISKVKELQPDDLVSDKDSFRTWCATMILNPKQVAAILKISLPMVYRYLDVTQTQPLRGTVLLACNLISEKSPKARMLWLQRELLNMGCPEPWPATNPVVAQES